MSDSIPKIFSSSADPISSTTPKWVDFDARICLEGESNQMKRRQMCQLITETTRSEWTASKTWESLKSFASNHFKWLNSDSFLTHLLQSVKRLGNMSFCSNDRFRNKINDYRPRSSNVLLTIMYIPYLQTVIVPALTLSEKFPFNQESLYCIYLRSQNDKRMTNR